MASAVPLYYHDYESQPEKYQEELTWKVRMVLNLCAEHQHRHLVVGAWGCGHYGNPPLQVARAFYRELFQRGRDAWPFEHVSFAIAHDEDSFKAFSSLRGNT